MKITIESYNSKVFVECSDTVTVDEAIRLCESALSASFGYGIKIHEWQTYICPEEEN